MNTPYNRNNYANAGQPDAPIYTQRQLDLAVAEERRRWRGFTAHCQRVAAALKAQMTAAQVVAHLDAKMAESIDRMTSGDGSDLDPDLVEWVNQILGNEPLTLKEQS